MPAPLLVVITGHSASGKTTLARRLAADTVGALTTAWGKRVGCAW